MNTKELTELKKEFRDTFGVAYQLQRINGTEESVLVMDINYFSVDKVFDFFLPHLKSNDEIKREAFTKFKALREYIDGGWIDGGEWGMSPKRVDELFDELETYLTQKENNE